MEYKGRLRYIGAASAVFLVASLVFLSVSVTGARNNFFKETRIDAEDDFNVTTSNPSEKTLLYVTEPDSRFFYDNFEEGLYWWDTSGVSMDAGNPSMNGDIALYNPISGNYLSAGGGGRMTTDVDFGDISGYNKLQLSIVFGNVNSGSVLTRYYDGNWHNIGEKSPGSNEVISFDMSSIPSDTSRIRIRNKGGEKEIDEVAISGGSVTKKSFRMESKPDSVTIEHSGLPGGEKTFNVD